MLFLPGWFAYIMGYKSLICRVLFLSFQIGIIVIRYKLFFLPLLILSVCSCKSNLNVNHQLLSDTIQIKNDMDSIVKTDEFRNYKNLKSLNKVADYIKRQFQYV